MTTPVPHPGPARGAGPTECGCLPWAARGERDLPTAWAVLREHPALMWTPPLWRHDPRGPVYRAIERNLLVEIVYDDDGSSVVHLATGPLRDRVVGDDVDPVAPVAERDERLDVRAGTFEGAVGALADMVVACYGAADRHVCGG